MELELLQFHFHAPSEHAMDGKRYAMEVHLVHKNKATGGSAMRWRGRKPGIEPVCRACTVCWLAFNQHDAHTSGQHAAAGREPAHNLPYKQARHAGAQSTPTPPACLGHARPTGNLAVLGIMMEPGGLIKNPAIDAALESAPEIPMAKRAALRPINPLMLLPRKNKEGPK